MPVLNRVMFRAYDIRGKVADELTPEAVETIGRAFGTYIQSSDGTRVAVGHDNRTSSPMLHQAFIAGARAAGCHITDIGLATSPMLYFAVIHLGLDGGVNVTGSHNPVEYNGLKMTGREARPIAEEEIQEIRSLAERGEFARGQGGLVETSVEHDYIEALVRRGDLQRQLKVCVDCGNGTASPFAPQVLRRIGCDLVELYCESDGTFPHHLPNPEQEETLHDLKALLRRERADLGIAFDGDCDRLGVLDENARRYEADEMMILLARDFLARHPGERVMIDVKCSQVLMDDIKAHGGVPVMYKTGHSLIKREMREQGILMAGEVSGHLFFADDYYGFDDGLYSAVRFLNVISRDSRPLSRLWEGLPHTYRTPELKAPTPEADKFRVVEEIKHYFAQHYPVLDIDGARVSFPDGWALVRASNTNPYLTLRFEAATPEGLARAKDVVYSKLADYPMVELPADP